MLVFFYCFIVRPAGASSCDIHVAGLWKYHVQLFQSPIPSGQVRNFSLLVLRQGIYSCNKDEYPDYEIYIFLFW